MGRSIVCIGDIFGDVHIPYGEAQSRMRLLVQGETDAVPPGVKLCPGGSMPTTSALLHNASTLGISLDSMSDLLKKEQPSEKQDV